MEIVRNVTDLAISATEAYLVNRRSLQLAIEPCQNLLIGHILATRAQFGVSGAEHLTAVNREPCITEIQNGPKVTQTNSINTIFILHSYLKL